MLREKRETDYSKTETLTQHTPPAKHQKNKNKGIVTSTDAAEACAGVDVAVMVGGFPRKAGMERKDVMGKNVAIYAGQAAALAAKASKDVKVLVVANPANTNALMLAEHAPSIPRENITAMTRLDHNRALAQVAERAGAHVTAVKNVIIWGNHSSTQYPDVRHGAVNGEPISSVLSSAADQAWLADEFVNVVQQRGAAIIKARGLSSAMSAASAACDHVRDWLLGTPEGSWVSMGVVSDGSYGQPKGLVYSYPVTCKAGQWEIVQGLEIDEVTADKMRLTAEELAEERELALECINEAAAA
jgi:malate dehydrogenase